MTLHETKKAYILLLYLELGLLCVQAVTVQPQILEVEKINTTTSGGIQLKIKGLHLNTSNEASLRVTNKTGSWSSISKCDVQGDDSIICKTPNVTGLFSATKNTLDCKYRIRKSAPIGNLSIRISLRNYGQNKTYPLPVYADPKFCEEGNFRIDVPYFGKFTFHIKSTDLSYLRSSDIKLLIGDQECPTVEKFDYHMKCELPYIRSTQKNTARDDAGFFAIKVRIGFRTYEIGRLKYETRWGNTKSILIISAASIFMVWVVVAWFVCHFNQCRRKKKRETKRPPAREHVGVTDDIHINSVNENDNMETKTDHEQTRNHEDNINLRPQMNPRDVPTSVQENDTGKSFPEYYNNLSQILNLDLETNNKLKACTVDHKYVVFKECIGKGEFGKVFRGKLKLRGWQKASQRKRSREIAIKTIRDTSEVVLGDISAFITEAMVMQGFHHPNVVEMFGVSFEHYTPHVLLEYMDQGDLRSYIVKDDKVLTVSDMLNYGLQVAEGMTYLSKKGFIHRDLAARNCMINSAEHVKIGDFGMSRDVSDSDYYLMSHLGKPVPVKWMGLECFDGVYTTKSDVWSYGVFLWELLTRGQKPYEDIENYSMKDYLKDGNRLKKPPFAPLRVYDLMRSCWQETRAQRPTFEVIRRTLKYIISSNRRNNPDYKAVVTYENIGTIQKSTEA